ncbi:hypothetical protein KQI52_07820 [bacterium]|nr:hypothetical protein [bacterium]
MAHAATVQENSTRTVFVTAGIALLLLATAATALHVVRGPSYALALTGGLVFLVWGAWKPWLLPAGYLAFMILSSNQSDQEYYPVFYHIMTFLPAFTAMVILHFADRTVNPNTIDHSPPRPDFLGKLVLLFLAWCTFTYLRGLAIGNPLNFMMWEISYISMFFAYFFWRGRFRLHGNMINWNWLLLALGIGTAFETASLIMIHYTDVISLVLNRILNRQPQITMLTVPLAMTFFLTRKTTWTRTLGGALVLITMIHVFLSQQRSLWLAAVVIAFVYFTLYVFRKGFTLRTLTLWLMLILLIGALFAGLLFGAAYVLNADLSVLLTRWEDVQSLTDDSFLIRVWDFRNAVEEVGGQGWLGLGGGQLNNWVHTMKYFYYFDFSYGMAYYKGGWPMVILMVAVYAGVLIQGFRLYIKAKDRLVQLLGITYTSTIAGVMFVGMFNTGMLYFRFIFIWMLIAASATVLLEKMQDEEDRQLEVASE